MSRRTVPVLLLLLLSVPGSLAAQYFGRNKVQYTNFDFKVIQTEHFDVYYYDRERVAALDAARMAERGYAKLSKVLNHEFNNWSRSCKNMIESCVRSIAVHEFGHALGFAHEQNRPDTPGECSREHGQGQKNEIMLTPYDAKSVMNYCNEDYNNNGELSPLDTSSAQKLYGRPRS